MSDDGRVRTRYGWQVGRRFRVLFSDPPLEGECFRVTKWGRGRTRWVWLRFADGSEKAFAPSHLRRVGELDAAEYRRVHGHFPGETRSV